MRARAEPAPPTPGVRPEAPRGSSLRLRELAGATALVALAAAVLLWRVLLLGEVLLPADIVFQDPAWRSVAPAGFTRAQNPLISDQIRLFYVLHDVAARSLAAGDGVPLWNPYAFAGQPLVGNAQSALFYPPNLLLRWLPATAVAGIRAVFLLVAGGVFAYLYARRIGTSHAAGCLAALGFVLGGPFVVWLGFPLANVLVWLPFVLWAAEGLLAGGRPLLWTALAGLGLGLAILGGHPETSFHVAALFAVYVLARLPASGRRGRAALRVVGCVAAAGLLGVAIGAVQLLPFLDALLASSTLGTRRQALAAEPWLYGADWLTEAATGVTLLYPTFFGTPVSGNYAWPFAGLSNYNRQTLYFGAVALALALAAVGDRERPRVVRVLAALALVCLLVAWRFPLFELANHLPFVSVVRNDRLRLPFAFFGAVLAGFGLDALRRSSGTRPARAVLVTTVLVPPLVLAAAAAAAVLPQAAPRWAARLLRHASEQVFVATELQSFVPLAIALAALVLLGVRLPQCARVAALVGLAGVELLALAWGYNPSVPEALVFPETAVTRRIGASLVPPRVIGIDAFWPNYGTPYGIAQIEAYDLPVPGLFADLYRAQGGRGEEHHQRWRPEWPLARFLGVEYVVSSHPVKQRGLVPVLRDGSVWLYRTANPLPRALVVHDVAVIEAPRRALARLARGRVDLARTVVLHEPLPAEAARAIRPPPPGSAPSRASFVSYRPEHVVIDVLAAAPGVLVTSEAYAAGWQATLDGEPVPIHRANHAFRAVLVPEGRHTVAFTYRPLAARTGYVLTALGVLVAVSGAALGARLRPRPGRAV